MLAILPDIHANRQALDAVLADALSLGATRWAALGDIIGFGAEPAACAQRVRQLGACALRGNHEAALRQPELFAAFPEVQRMTERTRNLLPPPLHTWLTTLPCTAACAGIPLTHATFHAPERWGRLAKEDEARLSFAAQAAALAFFGHTHRPTIFCQNEAGEVERIPIGYDASGSFRLKPEAGRRYLVNPGSVGQPRDGDARAAYGLWDGEHVLLRRVAYDAESAAEQMRQLGWTAEVADRLRRGLSPV